MSKSIFYLLNNSTLIVSGSKVIKIDDLLNVSLHITDQLELNIGLKKSSGDLVKALIQNFLINDCRIAHLLKSTRYARTQLCQHHLYWLIDLFQLKILIRTIRKRGKHRKWIRIQSNFDYSYVSGWRGLCNLSRVFRNWRLLHRRWRLLRLRMGLFDLSARVIQNAANALVSEIWLRCEIERITCTQYIQQTWCVQTIYRRDKLFRG